MSDPEAFTVAVQGEARTTAIAYAADADPIGARLILAHGAGADQRSAWMVGFARALTRTGLDVVTFNFLYTEQRRRAPDRRPLLEACYRAVVFAVRGRTDAATTLVIGGKSMGGRIATHVAAAEPELPVQGIVLLGYPLHAPGRPLERRDAHLAAVGRPMLFVQGSRDAFGTPEELEPVLDRLTPTPTLHVVEGGDHSFKASRNAARQLELFGRAQRAIADWIRRLP